MFSTALGMREIGMDVERLSRLSEGQRTCLRLVYMHMSSKDVARELGISPHTVDQRIKVAMQILGVDSRIEAARLLARHEGAGTYQPLVYQSPDIVADVGTPPIQPPVEHQEVRSERSGYPLRQEQAAFRVVPFAQNQDISGLPPDRGSKGNDLGVWQKIGWIIAVAMGAALSFGAILGGLDALARLT